MSRCGCDSGCQCVVQAGANTTVTGTGSLENPYVIAGTGGAVDLSAYVGDVISLTATTEDGILLDTTAVDGTVVIQADAAGGVVRIHANGVGGGMEIAATAADADLNIYAGRDLEISSVGLGFFGVPGVAQPDGVSAGDALEALGLATNVTAATLGAQDQTFSYAGALASGTTSPPVRLRFSQTATLVAVTLGTAGSTSTVLDLLKNGVSVDTITVAAAGTIHDEVLSVAYTADTDVLELTVTTAGTGAADMTATVRFT